MVFHLEKTKKVRIFATTCESSSVGRIWNETSSIR